MASATSSAHALRFESLPTDLLDALRAGAVVNVNRSAIVDPTERVIEFRAEDGRVWRGAITSGGSSAFDTTTSTTTMPFAEGRRQSGPWSSVVENNGPPTTALPSSSSSLTNNDQRGPLQPHPHGKNVVTQPVAEEVKVEEWVRTHVLQTVALRPITLPALRRTLRELWQQQFPPNERDDGQEPAVTSGDVIDEEVQRAVKQYAFVVNSRSEDLDLNASGLRLVQLAWYESDSQKRQAANRLAPRMQREGLAISEDLLSHMDRDVYLDLFSKGGIMSGMKGTRGGGQSEGSEVEHEDAQEETDGSAGGDQRRIDEAAVESGRPPAGSGNKRRRIERMEDLQLDLDSGDLTTQSLLALASPEVIVEVEELASERMVRQNQKMAPSPLLTGPPALLEDAQKRYDKLQLVFDSIDSALRKHEAVCTQLSVKLHEMKDDDASSSTSPLRQEVMQWAQKQATVRPVLVDLWSTLRVELSYLRREIGDVMLLRDLLGEDEEK